MVKPFSCRTAGLLLPALTVLFAPRAALAADPPTETAEPKTWENQKDTRRGGFTVGTMVGFGVASVVGFPNDAKKINRARYYTETGTRPGTTGGLWLGGALTDWFTFGVGFNSGMMFATGDNKVTTGGFIFHLEAFPLFSLGGRYRDLGVMVDAGIGVATVVSKAAPDQTRVGGSGCSIIGGGVFWEGVRFWKIHGGPFLAGNYYFADTVRRPGIFLGWRMALYATSP